MGIGVYRRLLSLAVLCGLLTTVPSVARSEFSHQHEERIAQVEHVLKHAAKRSPRWHSHQASIQRDVHDIGYFVEQAIRTADPDSMREYAGQALLLLQRALHRGHFHPQDVAPVLSEIQQLLPERTL